MGSTETQESPMMVKPQKEHLWLQRFVGEWDFEGEAVTEPGQPQEHFEGTQRTRSIGGIWIVTESDSPMADSTPSSMIMTIGYDPQKQRFVGTMVASMMTHLWIYEGALEPGENALTLESEGPSMSAGGRIARFQDTAEFKDDDHFTLTSRMLGDDGQWHVTMIGEFRRRR